MKSTIDTIIYFFLYKKMSMNRIMTKQLNNGYNV